MVWCYCTFYPGSCDLSQNLIAPRLCHVVPDGNPLFGTPDRHCDDVVLPPVSDMGCRDLSLELCESIALACTFMLCFSLYHFNTPPCTNADGWWQYRILGSIAAEHSAYLLVRIHGLGRPTRRDQYANYSTQRCTCCIRTVVSKVRFTCVYWSRFKLNPPRRNCARLVEFPATHLKVSPTMYPIAFVHVVVFQRVHRFTPLLSTSQ